MVKMEETVGPDGIPPILKTRIRSYLLSCENHMEPVVNFLTNWAQIYKKFTPNQYGYSDLLSFMKAVGPEYVRISEQCGRHFLHGVTNEQNKHIVQMIDKQKKPKKKKGRRDVGLFPRYQGSGYRQPFYRTNQPPNMSRRGGYGSGSRTIPVTHAPRSQHLPKSPNKPYHQVNFPTKPSAYDRVGQKAPSKPYQSYPVSSQQSQASLYGKPMQPAQSSYRKQEETRFYTCPARRSALQVIHQNANSPMKLLDSSNKVNSREYTSNSHILPRQTQTIIDRINSKPESKPSVFDRLGPKPETAKQLSIAPKRTVTFSPEEHERKEDIKFEYDENIPDTRTINLKNSSISPKAAQTPTPSPPVPKQREPVVKPPPSPSVKPPVSNSPDSVYVDMKPPSESSSSEDNLERANQFYACEDPEFLKLLVRHLLATLDDPQRTFTAAGITSRMRRQLVRSGIDIPNYLDEVLLQFMMNDWSDCFEARSGDEANNVQSEFVFTEGLRSAYGVSVKHLPVHKELDHSTVTVKITCVRTPAFYVTLTAEQHREKYNTMTDSLKNYIDSDPQEAFTYRSGELCAVYIETTKRYMRGRLQTHRIKVSPYDQSSSQISLVAVVFLVDTGEEVTVPAGDVYALPNGLCKIPPFAYRCIFSGAQVIDVSKFTSFMESHLEKDVELTAVASQKSADGIVLQVRLIGSSYLLDDLVSKAVMSKVTISEPDPKPFPINEESRVRFIDWHCGYRTILVQLYSDSDIKCLNDLEIKLGASVDRTTFDRVQDSPKKNCYYLWLQTNGTARRVRCVVATPEKITLQCMDHGCRCTIKDSSSLYLPGHEKVNSLFSSLPFMTSSIPLAMLPELVDEGDVMLNKASIVLKTKIRNLCPTGTILRVKHDSSIAESPQFILRRDDDIMGAEPSINSQYLAAYLDMRNWPEKQRFSAVLSPLDEDKSEGPIPGWRRWVVRFDSEDCSPNFAVPLREYRFMERCCLDFTLAANEGTINRMVRLSKLPHDEVVNIDKKIVFLSEQCRAVRATLVRPYCSREAPESVNIRLVDNPLKCVCSADPNFLFSLDESSILDSVVDKHVIDVSKSEIKHFTELLQHLPSLDQLVMTANPLTAELMSCTSDTPINLQVATFASDGDSRLPLVTKI